MVIVRSKHFYVFEFARLTTGDYVVPKKWIKYKCHELAFSRSFCLIFLNTYETLSFRFYRIILTTLVQTHSAC